MTQPRTSALYRFFIEPRYSIDYRRGGKPGWRSEATSDYRVLFLISGSMDLSIEGQSAQIGATDVLLLEPSLSATGLGDQLETLTINLSAQMVIDCALRM